MANESARSVPDHIAPLLQPTPSGAMKLLAAWDGLGTETQILVLEDLQKSHFPPTSFSSWSDYPAYLAEKVWKKALESPNSYVRYLAARKFYFRDDDDGEKKAIKQRIQEDPDGMVRYVLFEKWLWGDAYLRDPKRFFDLPQEARLAAVRYLSGAGKTMATLIGYAADHLLPNGTVTEDELHEIVSDYVKKPAFQDYYLRDRNIYNGWLSYSLNQEVEALWRVTLKVPFFVQGLLVENLPPPDIVNYDIPEDVLEQLADPALEILLWRSDVHLRDLREKIFFEADETRDDLKYAACSHHFDLSREEFASILAKPEKERVRYLNGLVWAQDLSLCFLYAVHDVLLAADDTTYAWDAYKTLRKKLPLLRGLEREEQIRELRLYLLAKQVVPWEKKEKGYPLPDELAFLAESIVPGDTWGTFMAFCNSWWGGVTYGCYRKLPGLGWRKKGKSLPEVDGTSYEMEELMDDILDDTDPIGARVAKVVSNLIPATASEDILLVKALFTNEKFVEAVNGFETRINSFDKRLNELRGAQKRQMIISYVVIALLLGIFFLAR